MSERHHLLHEGPVLHCDPPAEFFDWLEEIGLEGVWDGRPEYGHRRQEAA